MKSQDVVIKLAALAQESRLSVFRLLVTQGEDGLCAGDIAKKLDISPNTLSFHLRELQEAGLIISDKQGRSVFYSLDIRGYRKLLKFLTEDCCKGNPQLCESDNQCS